MSAIKNWYSHLNKQSSHKNDNPFDETNKIRLEQSVLSPNLFHIASNRSSTDVKLINYQF